VSHRFLAATLTAAAATWLTPAVVAGQTSRPSASSKPSGSSTKVPRMPDGRPDLQGVWTMATFTPLQRPPNLAGKEFFTEEEAENLARLLTADGVDPLAGGVLAAESEEQREARAKQTKENIHYDNAIWLRENTPKGLSSRRTSLILEPSDGRIPPLVPAAQQREAERRKAAQSGAFDGYETRPLQERCVVWTHEGPPMIPPPYNDRMQIFQTPDYVAINPEVRTNPVRMIPLDNRPHPSSMLRQWAGDSSGHWEGDTLVVETVNYNDKVRFQGSSSALHVVERFTRIDVETIRYEFTVEDPTVWTRPWRAEIPLMKADGLLYEYGCHEGNHDIANILEITRNVEAAGGAKKPSK
jgi:hypothetical protein